jgi:hypothetical protein
MVAGGFNPWYERTLSVAARRDQYNGAVLPALKGRATFCRRSAAKE